MLSAWETIQVKQNKKRYAFSIKYVNEYGAENACHSYASKRSFSS
jgi:hypothetical protein